MTTITTQVGCSIYRKQNVSSRCSCYFLNNKTFHFLQQPNNCLNISIHGTLLRIGESVS